MQNRIIKFRAWDADNQQFVNCSKMLISDIGKEYAGLGNRYVFMQFTGLHDKNGKEIYEGDLLKGESDIYLYGNITPVSFYGGSFVATIQYDCIDLQLYECAKVYKPEHYPKDTDKSTWLEEFEIIGNLYENPEMCTV